MLLSENKYDDDDEETFRSLDVISLFGICCGISSLQRVAL